MKNILLSLLILTLFSTYAISQNEHADEKVEVIAKVSSDGKTYYGEDIPHDMQTVAIKDLYANPENYKGKTIVVPGKVTGVCQNTGCWVLISDGEKEVRVTTLHKFFFPKDLGAVNALAMGEFNYKEITEEQAKHYAKEQGISGDDIKGPQMMYFIKTTGTKILD